MPLGKAWMHLFSLQCYTSFGCYIPGMKRQWHLFIKVWAAFFNLWKGWNDSCERVELLGFTPHGNIYIYIYIFKSLILCASLKWGLRLSLLLNPGATWPPPGYSPDTVTYLLCWLLSLTDRWNWNLPWLYIFLTSTHFFPHSSCGISAVPFFP